MACLISEKLDFEHQLTPNSPKHGRHLGSWKNLDFISCLLDMQFLKFLCKTPNY
jgi:hypothetical protein